MHEASKPLARYRDDNDLEESLKNRERIGDPMLQYMRSKQADTSSADGAPGMIKLFQFLLLNSNNIFLYSTTSLPRSLASE